METVSKYYTPNVEDFFVGYEFERSDNGYNPFKDIFPRAIDVTHFFKYPERFLPYFLTKYLDKEDIESLGWRLKTEEKKELYDSHWCNFETKDWELAVQLGNRYFPRRLNLNGKKHCPWKGNLKIDCKSINELRKIMEWLQIQ